MTRYTEPGSTWWPVLWAPLFAGAGVLTEVLTGPVHEFAWVLIAVVLTAMTAAWVSARRRVCSVELTDTTLRLGQESLAVARIVKIPEADADISAEVESHIGARPLGGGLTVPRKTYEIPLTLDDGATVLAWARDRDALLAALRPLVEQNPES